MRAHALPPFSRDTANDWWEVAVDCFEESYPNAYAAPELRNLAYSPKTKANDRKRKLAKLSLAGRHGQIIENIRGKFISLAGRRTAARNDFYPESEKVDALDPRTEGESLDARVERLRREHGHEF